MMAVRTDSALRLGLGVLLGLSLLSAGCNAKATTTAVTSSSEATSPGASPASPSQSRATSQPGAEPPTNQETASAVEEVWENPEPPEAQALAERVLHAPFNRDKTTRLKMNITTLVDRTTGIVGFKSALAAADTSLDDRLSKLGAETSGTEVTIRLSGSVLFDFDKSDVRPDAAHKLAEVAEVIRAYGDRSVRIEGHTDSISSDAYNQKLSEARAASVRDWFVAEDVASSRLSAVGHGESRPVADNETAEGRQRNRRVEIVIEES